MGRLAVQAPNGDTHTLYINLDRNQHDLRVDMLGKHLVLELQKQSEGTWKRDKPSGNITRNFTPVVTVFCDSATAWRLEWNNLEVERLGIDRDKARRVVAKEFNRMVGIAPSCL